MEVSAGNPTTAATPAIDADVVAGNAEVQEDTSVRPGHDDDSGGRTASGCGAVVTAVKEQDVEGRIASENCVVVPAATADDSIQAQIAEDRQSSQPRNAANELIHEEHLAASIIVSYSHLPMYASIRPGHHLHHTHSCQRQCKQDPPRAVSDAMGPAACQAVPAGRLDP